jgi:hypothetical protein
MSNPCHDAAEEDLFFLVIMSNRCRRCAVAPSVHVILGLNNLLPPFSNTSLSLYTLPPGLFCLYTRSLLPIY